MKVSFHHIQIVNAFTSLNTDGLNSFTAKGKIVVRSIRVFKYYVMISDNQHCSWVWKVFIN